MGYLTEKAHAAVAEKKGWPADFAEGFLRGKYAYVRNLDISLYCKVGIDNYSNGFRAGYYERRANIQDLILVRGGCTLRHVRTSAQRNQASLLIRNRYEGRGYVSDTAATLSGANLVTFEASDNNTLFGTLSLRIDSSEGLFADELYTREIDLLRKTGHRVCEMTKLAFDPKRSSKEIIASLFHLGYIYARSLFECTDILIEVNPRHAAFYQRRLGFQVIGEVRNCPRVDAPAVLLLLAANYADQQITSFAGSHNSEEKTLYPYFFSDAELVGLAGALQ
jgi:hypothetical protein